MPRHACSRNKVQKPPGRQRHSQATSRVAQKGEVKGTPYSLIEWILIEKSRDINQKEWQAALRNVQELEFPRWQHPGIRTAVPRENSGQIWLFIEWPSEEVRQEVRKTDTWDRVRQIILQMTDTAPEIRHIHMIQKTERMFYHTYLSLEPAYMELFIAYMPLENLDGGKMKHTPRLFTLLGGMHPNEREEDPLMASIQTQFLGWIQGDVKRKGKWCRPFVFFHHWESFEAEVAYKEKQWAWSVHTKDGRRLRLAWDCFLYGLEEAGMLDSEVYHAAMQKV